ncbi:MAG: helix-turn-helix domain-containing protein [Jatrophihabitantaceae bacterium]
MRGLLLRLAESDTEAAAALRIISYFDALIDHHNSDLRSLVRAAAALAECPAGLQTSEGELICFDQAGQPVRAVDHPAEVTTTGRGDRVWLLRPAALEPTDQLILERMALTVAVMIERRQRSIRKPSFGDPALVELVLSAREETADRTRAIGLLGLRSDLPLRVVALATPAGIDPAAAAVALLARARPATRSAHLTVLGGIAAALVQDRGEQSLATDLCEALRARATAGPGQPRIRCGISRSGDPLAAHASWLQAASALKFAVHNSPEQAVASYDALGPLTLLAEIPPDRIASQPDVLALERLASTPHGAQDVEALDLFCQTGSFRAAAAALHLHHSSVAARLAHVEEALGWRLDTPEGRFRARLSLLARRLASNS